MKKMLLIAMGAILVLGTYTGHANEAASSEPTEAAIKAQTTCPVLGNPVSKDSPYVDADGKRIYACCAGCVETIGKAPATYINKMEAEGITLAKAPEAEASMTKTCPAGSKPSGCAMKQRSRCKGKTACGAAQCNPAKQGCGMGAGSCGM